jgi:hypothetical protein
MQAQQWRVLKPGDKVLFQKELTVVEVNKSSGDPVEVILTDEDDIEYRTNGHNFEKFLSRAKLVPRGRRKRRLTRSL